MHRSFTVMLLIAGLFVTAALRVHHCRGAVSGACTAGTHAEARVVDDHGPRMHTVLSARTPGSVGACSDHCAPHGTSEIPADDHPTAPPSHAPVHSHLGCVDSSSLMQTTGKGLTLLAMPMLSVLAPAVGSPVLMIVPATPQVARRGGDPPPGLRTTRIQV